MSDSSFCTACPIMCGANRDISAGACGVLHTAVARCALHMWEEPFISGKNGSGAIFFCGCTMRCIFCQNYEISNAKTDSLVRVDDSALADMMLSLQEMGAHNINFVTPTPHSSAILAATKLARENGLSIPTVYNTSGYERVETLAHMAEVVDIYLPDLKYVSPELSQRFSGRGDYFKFAAPAIKEMLAQKGKLTLDENGLAVRGVAIRHLVLPGCVDETRRVLDFVCDSLGKDTHLSLMGQYFPPELPGMKKLPPPLDRRLTRREYDRAVDYALSLGMENIYIQSLSSASCEFVPEFTIERV